MGLNYGQKRNRMESLKNPGDSVLYGIGQTSINYEKFDEQILYDQVNAKLDKQQEKIDNA